MPRLAALTSSRPGNEKPSRFKRIAAPPGERHRARRRGRLDCRKALGLGGNGFGSAPYVRGGRCRRCARGDGNLFRCSLRQHPADSEHRFGHGKGEALAAFTQAILLASTATVLAAQSCWRLIYPQQVTAITLGIWIAVSYTHLRAHETRHDL